MRRLVAPTMLLLLVLSCGGGGGTSGVQNNVPAAAVALDNQLKSGMVRFAPLVANVESSLLFVMNPGTPMAQGVTVAPDPAPGAPPNSVTFNGPYDANGDGLDETTMAGRATFSSDPASGWDRMDGQVTIDVDIPIVGQVYHSDISFSISSGSRLLTGSGTFTDVLTGNTTTMSAAGGTPLVVKPATGLPGAVSNACGYSLDGRMQLTVAGSSGTLTSIWNFSPNNPVIAVSGASFTDTSGRTTALPDSTADLRCGGSGTINDWVGTFRQNWACLPRESGQSDIAVTVTGPDTIEIADEDPPGSGNVKTYSATLIAANPHAVRGFFIGGPVGNRYREDFNWSLRKNGTRFSQFSVYAYFEGPNTGFGGICVASANRSP